MKNVTCDGCGKETKFEEIVVLDSGSYYLCECCYEIAQQEKEEKCKLHLA